MVDKLSRVAALDQVLQAVLQLAEAAPIGLELRKLRS